MTARLPLGCDWWSIPPAVERHVHDDSCAREPWALRRSDELLVARATTPASWASFPHTSRRPDFADRTVTPLAGDRHVRDEVRGGSVLTSPIAGGPARRWLEAADVALERFGPSAVHAPLDPERFFDVERQVGAVAAEIHAVLDAVAAASAELSGGGKWAAMHGDMAGYFGGRVQGGGMNHRLFCVLEGDGRAPHHRTHLHRRRARPTPLSCRPAGRSPLRVVSLWRRRTEGYRWQGRVRGPAGPVS